MAAEYQMSVAEIVAARATDAARGLTAAEARARLERDRPNRLAAERPVPAWRKFLAQFTDLLVILLLIATAVSAVLWLYERDSALPYDAIAISGVVLLNAVMGYLQEQRAESAIPTSAPNCSRIPKHHQDRYRQSPLSTNAAQ